MSSETTNKIEAAASEWLIRRESGQWTEADQANFAQWLGSSALNRVAFLRLELAWEEAGRLKALGAGIPGDNPPPPGTWNLSPFFDPHRTHADHKAGGSGATHTQNGPAPETAHRTSPHRWRHFAIAAGILLATAAGFGALQFWGGRYDRYTTPVGGIASVPLLDGSKITLNTNSQVRIALMDVQRRVDLEQGEAFFEVARNPTRPFVVQAGKKRVVAVGTKFSVRRDEESVEVMVIQGKVRIEDTTSPLRNTAADASGSTPPDGPDRVLHLAAGAIARTDGAGVLVEHQSLPEIRRHLSWRVGVLVFRDQTLADAVAEFNRYNVRRMVIADPAVAALPIEGSFRASNIDAFVRLLESGFPVRAVLEDDEIVLRSK